MKLLIGCILLFCCSILPATSQEVVVTKSGGTKTSLDLSGYGASGPAGFIFQKTLSADLARSGWFSLTRPASFVVTGSCHDNNGSLSADCRVMDVLKSTVALSKTYTDTPANARRLAHRVADDIIMATKGFRGICSGQIVMVGNGTGNKELYLCDADGGNLRQLTRDRSISLSPHWSPDGSRIVYTSFLKGGYADIYMINTQNGSRSVVARYPGINMAGGISPSGGEMLMVLSRDGNPEVYSKSFAGGQLTRLTRTKRAGEASPTWSPDGSQIAYVSDLAGAGSPQLYVMDRSGSSRRLTSRGKENVDPDWGVNNLIAYSSRRGGLYGIYILNPGSMDERLISPADGNYKDPAWAPDGRHLVCCKQEGAASRIYLLDTMGDPPVCLTPNGGSWFSPAWCSK
jgi:TolB protein